MRRRDEVVRDPSEQLYWLCSPVCLEQREDWRGEESFFRLLAELMRKTGRALSRVLGWGTGPC